MAAELRSQDYSVQRAMLQAGVRPEQVLAVHGGPASNAVIVMTTTRVVKVAAAAPLNVRAEVRMWATARSVGIPAPELVGADDGAVPEWLSYRLLVGSPGALSGAGLRVAGGLLARLHDVEPSTFPERLTARPRRLRRFALAREFFQGVGAGERSAVLAALDAAEGDWDSNRSTPTHGDFRSANLLGNHGHLTGVVDWSEGRQSSRERDLGSVDAAVLPEVLAGYLAAGGRFSPDLVAGHLVARYGALAHSGVIAVPDARAAIARASLTLGLRGEEEA